MKKLVIIGASGFGKEVAWLVERINDFNQEWDLLGFVDDDKSIHGTQINGHQVLGDINWLLDNKIYAICAVASARVRKKIVERLPNQKYATLIDPTVIKSKYVQIGEGTIICAGTIITTNIKIESHVIINLDCTIGHDAYLQSFTTFYPSVNVSGNTNIGTCVEMGTGSCIIQGLSIDSGTIVGAGATVIKNLPKNCVAVGSPAKPVKFIE